MSSFLEVPADALDALIDPAHPRAEAAAAWAAERLDDDLDRSWAAAAADGLLGLVVAADRGGAGRRPTEALLTFEGIGRTAPDAGVVFALASQVFAFTPALLAGADPAVRDEVLPGLLAGSRRGAFAMTEPEAGSDIAALATTATLDGRHYRLDGEKTWITNAPVADLAVVFATTDPTKGRWGITAFLVDAELPGVERRTVPTAGLASAPFGGWRLEGVKVPTARRLGPEGAGAQLFASAVEAERAFLYAAELGRIDALLRRTEDRVRSRRQFGRTLGQFQAVSHRLVDLRRQWEAARLLTYRAGVLADRGRSVAAAAAQAKLAVSETALAASLAAVELHGAEGFADPTLTRSVLDGLGGLAYSGPPGVQRTMLSRLAGLDRPRRPVPSQE